MTGERGFSLVEVLIAATIVSVGILGTLKAVDSGQRLSRGSERNQQALAYAQSAVEEISSLPWGELGLTQAPASAPDATPGDPSPSTPAAYVTAAGTFLVHTDPRDRTSPLAEGVPAGGEPFVVVGASGVDPTPQDIQVGHTRGRLYRYVTRVDRCMTVDGVQHCTTDDTLRRLTVAVVLDGAAQDGVRKPIWMSTVISDPAAQALAL